MNNNSVMGKLNAIKLVPEQSVMKLQRTSAKLLVAQLLESRLERVDLVHDRTVANVLRQQVVPVKGAPVAMRPW